MSTVAHGGVSPVPREARPFQGRRAGLVTRMVAAVIDGVLVIVALLGGYVALSGLIFLVDPRGFSFPDVGLFLSLAAAFWVLVVYLTVTWWIAGRSYGCLVMGLRVLSPWGTKPTLALALLRAVFCAAFPVGLLWVAVNRENRSLQDVMMRTSVVYDWEPGARRLRGSASGPAGDESP